MWMSNRLVGILEVAKESVDDLREQLAAIKAERDLLKDQLRVAQVNLDWLRLNYNTLQMERAQLLQTAHGISVPVPQIQRKMEFDPAFDPNNFGFDDLGDEAAKKLGLPVYDK